MCVCVHENVLVLSRAFHFKCVYFRCVHVCVCTCLSLKAIDYNTLQHSAAHCNTLQHIHEPDVWLSNSDTYIRTHTHSEKKHT